MTMEKLNAMPYNLEAEQSLLGCIIIDQENQTEITNGLYEDDFYVPSHKVIYSAMEGIAASNKPIDIVTLSDALEKSANLEKVGGISYLTTIARSTPSASNYNYYLDIVKRDGVLRRLIKAAEGISKEARSSTDSDSALSSAEKAIFDISEHLDTSSLEDLKGSYNEVLDKFEKIEKNKDYTSGLKSGYPGIDALTNGFSKGALIILAARPSIGKTTLALNFATNIALRQNAVVALFALEMTKDELAQKMMCSIANVRMDNAVKGKLTEEDWLKLWNAKKELDSARIFVDDTSMTTPKAVLSKCRRLKSRQGLDLVIIDHIQLMEANNKNPTNRQQEITEISRALKMMAKELNVPVIALSQLSRLVTGRKGKRPMLSDLRESGAIEQDADIVMFIHRPDLAPDMEKEKASGEIIANMAEIIFEKNRSGERGDVKLLFKGEFSKFVTPTKFDLAAPTKAEKHNDKQEEPPADEEPPIGEEPPFEEVPLPEEPKEVVDGDGNTLDDIM